MNYEKKYNEALERAKAYHRNELAGSRKEMTEYIFPELREKPLTPFQQCLNCILRGVYYAEVPDKKVNEFILNVVRTRTDELIKLAKKHEHTDFQLHKSKDEEIRQQLLWLCDEWEHNPDRRTIPADIGNIKQIKRYLEKQKEYHIPWYDYQKSKEAGYTIVPNEEYEQLIKQKEQKPTDKEQDSIAFLEQHGYTIVPPHAPVSIVPSSEATLTEWSEEDKEMIDNIISSLHGYICIGQNNPCFNKHKKHIQKEIDFLNALRPQPHWKPSEEQMRALIDIICFGKISYVGQEEELIALKNQLLKLM